jgi:hypothetical protein
MKTFWHNIPMFFPLVFREFKNNILGLFNAFIFHFKTHIPGTTEIMNTIGSIDMFSLKSTDGIRTRISHSSGKWRHFTWSQSYNFGIYNYNTSVVEFFFQNALGFASHDRRIASLPGLPDGIFS